MRAGSRTAAAMPVGRAPADVRHGAGKLCRCAGGEVARARDRGLVAKAVRGWRDGSDLDTPQLTAARDAFHATVDDLASVAAEKTDLSVLFADIPAEGDWLAAITRDWPELQMYERLGVKIVSATEESDQYWESISREDALRCPADVLMSSAFVESSRLEDLQEDPTFSRRPNVRAGQVGMWRSEFIISYQGLTELMQQFFALLEGSSGV